MAKIRQIYNLFEDGEQFEDCFERGYEINFDFFIFRLKFMCWDVSLSAWDDRKFWLREKKFEIAKLMASDINKHFSYFVGFFLADSE